eukprot:RCo044208
MAHPLAAVLKHFPPTRLALAYGSAVFAQPGNVPKMTDLIFAVDDPVQWHTDNLQRHSGHYSMLRHFGPGAIATVQSWGGGMYFNPDVTIEGKTYKYGVISVVDFLEDLNRWPYIYVCGRLQKPVLLLQYPSDVKGVPISRAMRRNLRNALAVALLRLPPFFEEHQLYHEISKLSYEGDLRMAISAEDPKKAEKIVLGSFRHFSEYYSDALAESPFGSIVRRCPPPATAVDAGGSLGGPPQKAAPATGEWQQVV